jgi:hypothetical protein
MNNRRQFLINSTQTGLGLGALGFLGKLPLLKAEETTLAPSRVAFLPENETLVRLLEDTPRERLLEEVASRIKSGTTYRDWLTSLFLAGVRNIQPRPVGFKFHAVLVINSAHLASINAPDSDRWLPLFWAMDAFKASQASDVKEGDWTMKPVDESRLATTENTETEFRNAMENWDVERSDVAAAAFTRSAGAQQIFDQLCHLAARDFRDIGHKIIYVANSWRTLQTIGWQHAEPIVRSLAYALLAHEGENPAKRDAAADQPGRWNNEKLTTIRDGWTVGKTDPTVSRQLLSGLRTQGWQDVATQVITLLNQGYAPSVIWDALFSFGVEMLMKKPGIVTLHSLTSLNAFHFAWQNTSRDHTRRFLLLQAASFLPLFRDGGGARDGLAIEDLKPVEGLKPDVASMEGIFELISRDRPQAARQCLGFLEQGGSIADFRAMAQRLVYMKGTDAHDYKFSSAVLEDFSHLSPHVRHRFLAASVFWLKGSAVPDSSLVQRTRNAFGA